MHIVELQGENFKKMKAFRITPKGPLVVISGKNGQGKTSVLDSIVMALAGEKTELAKLTTKPIRNGETHASVTVTTPEAIITRTWTEKDSYLEMKSPEGVKYKSPQHLLDQMTGGDLSFDPLAFTREKPRDQRDALLGIVKLDFDLDAWERDYKLKYDTRTAVGNQGKALQGKLDTTPAAPEGTPDEELSITALMDELHQADSFNTKLDAAARRLKAASEAFEAAKKELEEAGAEFQKFEKPEQIDTAALRAKLSSAEDTNRAVRTKKERVALEADVKKHDAEYEKLTNELKAMQEDKAKRLAAAKFPIEGLSFAGDEVTYKGIPLAQCSAAEQLKVSMAIAMAKNPKLKVIRIVDGSLLDESNMEIVQEMAERNGFQVWIERVDSSGTQGVVISDGEIVKDNSQAAV